MAKHYQILLKQRLQDLNPLTVGEAELPPGYIMNLHMQESCELHRVRKGRGILKLKDKTYHVKAGEFFLIMIGEKATCIADEEDPWELQWIGFTGVLSHDFAQLPPVFSLPDEIVDRLFDLRHPEENMGCRIAGDLFLLHSKLITPKDKIRDYVQITLDTIQTSYMHKLSVAQLAKEMGIDRSYLSRLFKSKMNISIQDYLLRFRISESKRYLKSGYSVKETALLCGFNDPPNFTRLFKRQEQISPRDWINTYVKQRQKEQPFR